MKNEKHEFAFFTVEAAALDKDQREYALKDKELVHRLIHIVRVQVGETIVLFDSHVNARCKIISCSKKEIIVHVLEHKKNSIIKPAIIWLLPLLDREAFESALYALTAMGTSEIIPVITEKSRRAWGIEKERERAQRIMIAAAEQSKQFSLPTIKSVMKISDVATTQGTKLFFDAQGNSAFDVIARVRQNKIEPIVCAIGPEGDLTNAEKELLRSHGFTFCALTPTILKASAAVEVGMGLLRSCL